MSALPVDPLVQQAAQAFAERSGVPAHAYIIAHGAPHGSTEAEMQIDFPGSDALRLPVVVIPTLDRHSRIEAVKALARNHVDGRLLLVTHYLSAGLLERCRTLGVSAMDRSGNAYVHSGNSLVFISGNPRAATSARSKAKAWTAKGLQVLFALLADPRLLRANYRAIADAAGVSLGTVQQVIGDLIARGMAVRIDDRLTLTNPGRLVDEWVLLYPARLRRSVGRFAASNPDWWKTSDVLGAGCQWGGEIAAARLSGYLKPATATIYCAGIVPKSVVAAGRLRKDDNGPIEFVDAFVRVATPEGIPPDIAHPLLVYADLMASGDSRNIETAQLIRDQYLAAPSS